MLEHEKLKEIIDKIGYELHYEFVWHKSYKEFQEQYNEYSHDDDYFEREVNVREIIFTTEFMDKFENKTVGRGKILSCRLKLNHELMKHLNNPVEYLYGLLFENE